MTELAAPQTDLGVVALGEWSSEEVQPLEQTAASAELRLANLRQHLARIRETAAAGIAEQQARRLEAALEDGTPFRLALDTFDAAAVAASTASKELRRCRSRHTGRRTQLSEQRQSSSRAAELRAQEAREVLLREAQAADLGFLRLDGSGPLGSSVHWALRRLRESHVEGRVPQELEEAERAARRARAQADAACVRQVTPERVRQLAKACTIEALVLLDGLSPFFEEVDEEHAKSEELRQLVELGLVEREERRGAPWVRATKVGRHEVLEWARSNLPAFADTDNRPALSPTELAEAFSREERVSLIGRVKEALAALGPERRGVDGTTDPLVLDLGDVTYRVPRSHRALRHALVALGARRLGADRPRAVQRKPVPSHEPGRFEDGRTG